MIIFPREFGFFFEQNHLLGLLIESELTVLDIILPLFTRWQSVAFPVFVRTGDNCMEISCYGNARFPRVPDSSPLNQL